MLLVKDEAYLAEVRAFAGRIGMAEQLESRLAQLAGDDDTRCDLYRDCAPYSFYFVIHARAKSGEYVRWYNGGLIFHGAHDNGGDGGAPTYSVSLTPCSGWSIHT